MLYLGTEEVFEMWFFSHVLAFWLQVLCHAHDVSIFFVEDLLLSLFLNVKGKIHYVNMPLLEFH